MRFIIVALLLTLLSSFVIASPYSARVMARQVSPADWIYTVYNTSTSPDYNIVDISFEASPSNITAPDGWYADWSGKDDVWWINSSPNGDPVSLSHIYTVGACLIPGHQCVFEFSFDPYYYINVSSLYWIGLYGNDGYKDCMGYVEIKNAASVPEPVSIIALLCGIGGIMIRRKAR